jgi:hypothetical protein
VVVVVASAATAEASTLLPRELVSAADSVALLKAAAPASTEAVLAAMEAATAVVVVVPMATPAAPAASPLGGKLYHCLYTLTRGVFGCWHKSHSITHLRISFSIFFAFTTVLWTRASDFTTRRHHDLRRLTKAYSSTSEEQFSVPGHSRSM